MTEQRTGPVLGMLAVADPRPHAAIGDWRPFQGGSRLGEIVERCNEQCSAAYRSRLRLPEDRKALTELFDLLPFDLSHVDELESPQLATLRFILLDAQALARLGRAAATELVERVKDFIQRLPPTRLLYLTQVRGTEDAPSWAGAFATVRVVADRPEFIASDDQLAAFLLRSCELLQAVQVGLASFWVPGERGTGVLRGRDNAPTGRPLHVARELLDAALDADLSVAQASRFARAVGGVRASDSLSDAAVPDRLKEAARAIKSGNSIENVAALIQREAGTRITGPEAHLSGGEHGTQPAIDRLGRPDVMGRGGNLRGGGGLPGGLGGGTPGRGGGPSRGGGGGGSTRGGGGRGR